VRRLPLPLLALALIAGCGSHPTSRAARPAAATPAFAVLRDSPAPAAQRRPQGRYELARLTRRTQLRRDPGGRAFVILHPHTEFGSPRILAVTRSRGAWLQVITSAHDNRGRGWIPAASARLDATDTSLLVERSRHRLALRHGSRIVRWIPIAVGRPGNETPLGHFAVTDKLRTAQIGSPYGCCALALSGHQRKLEPGWPGGDRLAIHGTPSEWTVGKAVSLGCMRAYRKDISALLREVPAGAPVFVRA
jgi:hypothetical protein